MGTTDGKPLCEEHGVEGFPTIKWGDPTALEDYDGGRDLKDLESFAKENLKPLCSPSNIDLCDDAKKTQIKEYQAMSDADLASSIEKVETEMKDVSENFDKEVEKLQATYEALEKTKTDKMKELKDAGLGLMKAVQATKGKSEL